LTSIKPGKSAALFAWEAAADRIVDAQIDLYCPWTHFRSSEEA